MLFEWDETKNRINLEKHGLDFNAVFTFDWENAFIADRTREGDGEQRYAALGVYAGKIHTVVFTKRGRTVRIISLRRANRTEERAYESAKANNDNQP
jgi:uncharacterized DUF497 family protein